ncbi:MAG: hypothetical protein A2096_10125 [Spirochaetes bacterium GWF1_41_5]|nr:MAG: hypothetical protein A2096_10125 [Spirochaetes bacterium GWF1_41_5]HBE02529.1 non-canonical purine NTP pyrophosphatase, RdgB/HAM1 family [Spirochaetia bacterium]
MRFKKIILATHNNHKVEEIKNRLPIAVEIADLSVITDLPVIEEDGKTFFENALKKAKTVFEHTSLPALADDSGLIVPALGDEPGVFSARYAGENATGSMLISKLIERMKNLEKQERIAYFQTVLVFYYSWRPDNLENILSGIKPHAAVHKNLPAGPHFIEAEGKVFGRITDKPRGTSGFGYDPLFIPEGFDKTFAEMSMEEKNNISHRSIALQKFLQRFRSETGEK